MLTSKCPGIPMQPIELIATWMLLWTRVTSHHFKEWPAKASSPQYTPLQSYLYFPNSNTLFLEEPHKMGLALLFLFLPVLVKHWSCFLIFTVSLFKASLHFCELVLQIVICGGLIWPLNSFQILVKFIRSKTVILYGSSILSI